MVHSHLKIIADLGGPRAIAGRMNVKPARVRMWKMRERIPRTAWPEIIEAFPSLSVEALKAGETA